MIAHADVGIEALERPERHRLGDLARDRPVLLDQLGGDAEQVALGGVGVGDDAAGEVGGRAGQVGQPRRQQPGRAGLGERELATGEAARRSSSIVSPSIGVDETLMALAKPATSNRRSRSAPAR